MVTASTPAYRYVKGLAEQTKVLAPASTAISTGDLLFTIPSGGAEVACGVASSYTWTSTLGQTGTNFAAQFLGVANDNRISSDSTSNQRISVLTRGIFDYPCASLSSAAPIGSKVGPDKDTGNNLLDQQLVICTGGAQIGHVVEFAPSGATVLRVELQSTQMFGQVV